MGPLTQHVQGLRAFGPMHLVASGPQKNDLLLSSLPRALLGPLWVRQKSNLGGANWEPLRQGKGPLVQNTVGHPWKWSFWQRKNFLLLYGP